MIETGGNEPRLPSAEDEARLWTLLENAWVRRGPEVNQARRALVSRPAGSEADTSLVDEALEAVLDDLAGQCAGYSSEELTSLDRVVERKLYDIDRADIHAVTDGSDDGFLYARGFIVAVGCDFYDAVVREPDLAVVDAECEQMCYFFAHLHRERFGDFPVTGSGISRESCANRSGWPG